MLSTPQRLSELARLLQRAAAAHHRAFAATGGADPDWPAWYGAYLVEPLAMLLGVRLTTTRAGSCHATCPPKFCAARPDDDH